MKPTIEVFEDGKSYEYRIQSQHVTLLHREGGLPAVHMYGDGDDDGDELFEYRENGRLHRIDGPAAYRVRDGKLDESVQPAIYHFHGVPVDKRWTLPGNLTVENISKIENPNEKAVCILVFGVEDYVQATIEDVIEIDQGETLTRALVLCKDKHKYLICTDGSTKQVYTLRVPDKIMCCADAYGALTNDILKDNDCVGQG